jgi:hypothetical protein
MNNLAKVLVVDDGERTPDRALSAELAELGLASITTPLEATEDVLASIPPPAAILLQLPREDRDGYQSFMDLAERLKASETGIPVILVDPASTAHAGGYASILESQFGAHALAKPEF